MLNVIELFAGIGSPAKALKHLYGDFINVVDIVEFDKAAVNIYNLIHGTNFKPVDIKDYSYKGDKDIFLIHASTPCQAFSVAGKGLGAEDERGISLWYETLRIIKEVKPQYVTLENVKGLLQEKHKEVLNYYLTEMEKLGYKTFYKCINAKNFNCAQERERVFFCSKLNDENWSFNIPEKSENFKNVIVADILDPAGEWIEVNIENITDNGDGFLYFENKLSSYKGKAIELNVEKLLNQNPEKINRVAVLKNVNYNSNAHFFGGGVNSGTFAAKSYCKFQNKIIMDDATFGNRGSFYGRDGKAACMIAHDAPVFKVLEIETIPFKEDAVFFGAGGHSRTLTTTSPQFKAKIIAGNEVLKYRSLTTLEVVRLMTFDDEDYLKIKDKASDNAICKAMGNSIVVNCLIEIYKNLFK